MWLLYRRGPTFSSWGFIHPWHVYEQHRQREAQDKEGPAPGSLAPSTGQGYLLQVSAAFSLASDWLLCKDSERRIWFGKKAGMWLCLLSHQVLLWQAMLSDKRFSVSPQCIFCSSIMYYKAVGLITLYFAYHTSCIPENLFPIAILSILMAKNHNLVYWRQEVPLCFFRDYWALTGM